MPNRFDIEERIMKARGTIQDEVRLEYLKKIHEHSKRDVILYASNPLSRADGTSIDTYDIPGFMSTLNGMKGTELDLIIQSNGGTLEGAEQLVNYLRAKYNHIRAIIPLNAMSAATMISCACNEIVMGKQSAIGPIDPQVSFRTPNGFVAAPAQTLVDDFEQAKHDVGNNPNLAPLWVSKIQDYPPGILTICNNHIKVAEERVQSWLEKYMFQGDPEAATKSKNIASWLNSHSTHKTHGHPISYLEAENHGLKVMLLESDNVFQDLVLSLFHALAVTFNVTNRIKVIEGHTGNSTYVMSATK